MNSIGEIQYKLIHINDQNQIVKIEFDGDLTMSPDTSLTGKWTFNI